MLPLDDVFMQWSGKCITGVKYNSVPLIDCNQAMKSITNGAANWSNSRENSGVTLLQTLIVTYSHLESPIITYSHHIVNYRHL